MQLLCCFSALFFCFLLLSLHPAGTPPLSPLPQLSPSSLFCSVPFSHFIILNVIVHLQGHFSYVELLCKELCPHGVTWHDSSSTAQGEGKKVSFVLWVDCDGPIPENPKFFNTERQQLREEMTGSEKHKVFSNRSKSNIF